jgi:hypothetical protein
MVTESPERAYERGWSVRSGFDPAEVPVLYGGDWAFLADDGRVFRPARAQGCCERCGFLAPAHCAGCQVAS